MKTSNIKDLIKQITGDMDAPRDQSLSNSYNPKGIRNPFAALPNVKSFKVEVNTYDPLLEKYGISRKLDPELKFERLNSKIRGTNRYLRIIFQRMLKLLSKGQTKYFWIYCLMLMRRCRAIRLSALRQLEHNWHIVFENKKVRTMLLHLDRFLIKGSRKFLIKRRYEDKIKPDGTKTYRPIGAPSYSARMLLYILYCFFSIFLGSYIRSYQHAYRRGKGLVTAWKDLSSKINSYRNSYEFDLKGFFPGINNSYIMWKLTELGVPKAFSDYIFDLNMEYPAKDTLDETKLPEGNAKFRAELDAIGLLRLEHKKSLSFDIQLHESEVLKPMWEFLKSNALEQFEQRVKTEGHLTRQELFDDCFSNCEELLISMMSEDLGYGYQEIKENWMACLYEYYQVQAALFESFKPQATPTPITTEELSSGKEAPFNTINLDSSKGLPQGGSLSPILSIFAFEQFLVRNYFEQIFNGRDFSLVAYADDFILLWNDDSITEKDITQKSDVLDSAGIEFSLEKSRPIRQAGKFVTEKFKFLGKTYFPELRSLVGTPRSGKINELPLSDVIEQYGKRHSLLQGLIDKFELDLKPQELLNSWGRGEFPYLTLPDSLMQDAKPLSLEQERFFSVALTSGAKNFSQFEELYPQLVEMIRGDISSSQSTPPIALSAPVGLGTTIEDLDEQWKTETSGKTFATVEELFKEITAKTGISENASAEANNSNEASFSFRPSSAADPADFAKYTGGSGNPFAYLEHKSLSGFVTSRLLDQGFVHSSEILPRMSKPGKNPNPKSWLSYAKSRKSYVNINLFNSSSYATLSLLNSNLFNTYGKTS